MKSSNGKTAENELLCLLGRHVPKEKIEVPVELTVKYSFPWNKSEPKKNKVLGYKPHDKRPDIDNLCKLLFDCMTKLGYWNDDSQISKLIFQKEWADKSGIRIKISDAR